LVIVDNHKSKSQISFQHPSLLSTYHLLRSGFDCFLRNSRYITSQWWIEPYPSRTIPSSSISVMSWQSTSLMGQLIDSKPG